MVAHPLRIAGSVACLAAVMVAGLTAWLGLREPRTRFISEILALWWRRRAEPRDGTWWGSALASLLMAAGSVIFVLDGMAWPDRLEPASRTLTGVALFAVVAIPLRNVDPVRARGWDFGHPLAAAAFYLAALSLGILDLAAAGPIGAWTGAIHVGSSVVLITMSIVTSITQFGPRHGAVPVLGTRILLDRRADSSARFVRWFQWPATVAAGVALCVGALGW